MIRDLSSGVLVLERVSVLVLLGGVVMVEHGRVMGIIQMVHAGRGIRRMVMRQGAEKVKEASAAGKMETVLMLLVVVLTLLMYGWQQALLWRVSVVLWQHVAF